MKHTFVFFSFSFALFACAPRPMAALTANPTITAEVASPTRSPSPTSTSTPSPTPFRTPTPGWDINHLGKERPLRTGTNLRINDVIAGPSGVLWADGFMENNTLESHNVFRSVDGGNTFFDITPPGRHLSSWILFLDDVQAYFITPWTQNREQGGYPPPITIDGTSDGGAHWFSRDPLNCSRFCASWILNSPDFLDSTRGWLMVNAKDDAGAPHTILFHTTNGGMDWNEIDDPQGLTQGSEYKGVLFDHLDRGYLWEVNPSASVNRLLRSADGGDSWSAIDFSSQQVFPPIAKDKSVQCSISDFNAGGIALYVDFNCTNRNTKSATEHWAALSEDAGSSWSFFTHPAGKIRFYDAMHAWVFGSTIYATVDGGKSWEKLAIVSWEVHDVSFSSPQDIWITALNGQEYALVVSHDGGKKWSMLHPVVG